MADVRKFHVCLTFEAAVYPPNDNLRVQTHRLGVRIPIVAKSEHDALEILRSRLVETLGDSKS